MGGGKKKGLLSWVTSYKSATNVEISTFIGVFLPGCPSIS